MLREVDGLDYEEIAQAIGAPKGTVMSRLFYARKALQKALEEFAPPQSVGIERDELETGDTPKRGRPAKAR
jgi:RNA polymerase sigma-70 factor (ECF subfamily)